jgi:superfamily II RNA helicase
MVKICNTEYTNSNYNEYFNMFPYPLSDFQKWAIEAIVTGQHVLVCAHTGSGKTLPAEFAIDYFVNCGKKVIYTAPIKALSNQKFHDFTEKYPNYKIGLITGDIKTNPNADVLIMTTEILLNTLYKKKCDTTKELMFEMDFTNELACVVFDEVHFICDSARGHVWEQSLMLLPPHVQLVLLSATLHHPENFAKWVESNGNKEVYLAATSHRVVPLTHYSFITCTQGLFKVLKDKPLEMEIMKFTNKPHMIQDEKGTFQDQKFLEVKKYLSLFEQKKHYVKRSYVLNQVCEYLVHNNMLPALCFIMSRKAIEDCAKEINTVLLEDDSKVPYIINKECEQILRKLPNYAEYFHLPEYVELTNLMQKGIAYHHAGMMPILRELVEIMFAKGFIKLLFATESMSIGVNMPVKTTIFTDSTKFDGSSPRLFYSHEYTQMAGRAGRRGIDTVGHVIHLNNLFRNMDLIGYKTMMKGTPQTMVSKFKISYNLILNLVETGETDLTAYVKNSMIQDNINSQLRGISIELEKAELDLSKLEETMSTNTIPKEVLDQYIQLCNKKKGLVNKKRKEAERDIAKIESEYSSIKRIQEFYEKFLKKQSEITDLKNEYKFVSSTLEKNVKNVYNYLIDKGFIDNTNNLTHKGMIATNLREIHCLAFADLIESGFFNGFSAEDFISVFSLFTNISVNVRTESIDNILLTKVTDKYEDERTNEQLHGINSGFDYQYHYELVEYIKDWIVCNSEEECKAILQKMSTEKDIFLGEYVKALLKINNIVEEMKVVAELLNNIEMLQQLTRIPELLLKFVVTNQSLYV